MPWLVPLCICLAMVAIVTGVFMAALKNARTLKRDIDQRVNAAQVRLERQANALADELFTRTKDSTE